MTIASTRPPEPVELPDAAELLIKEARQRTLHRRLRWSTLVIVLAVVVSLVVASGVGLSKPATPLANGGSRPSGGDLAVASCAPSGVTISNGPLVGGATQEEAHSLKITNTGSKSCLMNGYATLVAYGSTGEVLPFTFAHHATGGWPMATKAPSAFTIGRHKSAYVFFAQIACYTGYSKLASRIAVLLPKAPDLSKVLRLSTPLALCKGSAAKVGNVIANSPIEPTIGATEGTSP